MQERFRLPLVLIIIDTLMSAAAFKDANDAAEAQRVMTVLGDAAKFAKALVVVAITSARTPDRDANSSVKEDAVLDAVLALLGERALAGAVSNPRMALRKVKGGRAGEEIISRRIPSSLKASRASTPPRSLVIDWIVEGDAPKPKTRRSWPKSLTIFKNALDFALGDTGERIRPFVDGSEVLAANETWCGSNS